MADVLLAMSGGIDSTASAVLLTEQGHRVTGVTFGAGEIQERAAGICKKLDISHICLDLSRIFREEIIGYFQREYESGRTPNPCVRCNSIIKFGFLYEYAMEHGYQFLATGHYAMIGEQNGHKILMEARDQLKDQSYFLHILREEQLSRVLFPLGMLNKETARSLCVSRGLLPADSEESQEICFIKGNYLDYLFSLGARNMLGDFVGKDGEHLGRHGGILRYTVGQRKGLGSSFGKRLFVREIRPDTGEVVLAEETGLMALGLQVKNVHLIHGSLPGEEEICVRIRYRAPKALTRCNVSGDTLELMFHHHQRAVAPGQSAVLYSGNQVLGGGIIEAAIYDKEI